MHCDVLSLLNGNLCTVLLHKLCHSLLLLEHRESLKGRVIILKRSLFSDADWGCFDGAF